LGEEINGMAVKGKKAINTLAQKLTIMSHFLIDKCANVHLECKLFTISEVLNG
jgi:hypothetical protein